MARAKRARSRVLRRVTGFAMMAMLYWLMLSLESPQGSALFPRTDTAPDPAPDPASG